MKIIKNTLLILIPVLIVVWGLGIIWSNKNENKKWQQYTRKAYFEECKGRIEENITSNGRQRGTDAVWLSDELSACKTVAQERW